MGEWDAMEDERPRIYVHAEAASDDDVRTFYEIPEQVADMVRPSEDGRCFVAAAVDLRAEHDKMCAALHAIRGPEDQGPWMVVYREAGGGYAGLQAIAEAALA